MRIAFFVQHFICGGVERTLLTLTRRLADLGQNVTIYVIRPTGGFLKEIDSRVQLKVIDLPDSIRRVIPVGGTKMAVREDLSKHHYFMALRHLFAHKFGKSGFAELNVDFGKIPVLSEKYDVAVNYHIHSPFLVRYVCEKVTATKKYSWIHNDFTTTKYKISFLRDYLMCMNGFFGVAQNVVNEFVDIFPEFKEKTHLALNLVPKEEIIKKSEDFIPSEYLSDGLNILTVGRIEEQKRFDLAIEVCKKLRSLGQKFRWFVIGDGSLRKKMQNEIEQLHLTEYFIFLGIRKNPYPYFKHCDIYVQTSGHEGYVTTVTEAKIFNKPIVCTDVSGAKEQLSDGVDGFITEINADSIYEGVSRLLTEPQLRQEFAAALSKSQKCYDESWLSIFNEGDLS